MVQMKLTHLAHIIMNIISIFLLIISCVLIFTQSIKNLIYNYSNDKTILAEKLVYQQFSHDVYSNIKNKIIYGFEPVPYDNDCPEGKEVLKIPIKLDSYYDCEDIKGYNLANICENKISKSSICCSNECCEENIYLKQTFCREKNISNIQIEEADDIRNEKCNYFNVYNGKFSKIANHKICIKRYEFNYEILLKLNKDNICEGEHCFFFDTKNHCICNEDLKNELYSLNDSIIVKIISSEINPSFFEYETILKESILNNQIKITKKQKDNLNKYKILNNKNIYDAFFKDKKEIQKAGNKYYNYQSSFKLKDILSDKNDYILQNYINNQYIKEKYIGLYTRNYIGFKNSDELEKFQKIFSEDDPTNNPLYKICGIIYPNWETVIIIFLFFIAIIYIFYLQVHYFIIDKNIKNEMIMGCDSYRQIVTMVLLIIYLALYLYRYIYQFIEIKIDMEIYYKIVLDKYNERRIQSLLLAAVILLCINFIIELANFLLMIIINSQKGINPVSKYTINCILKNSFTNTSHMFKFYLNRKFSEEMKRFKKKYFENYDIDEFRIGNNNKNIEDDDYNKTISELELNNESIILVECEEK